MIWEAIAGGIKGLGDTILGYIKEFHMDPKEAADIEQKVRQSVMDFQRDMWKLEAEDRNSARQREMASGDPTTHRLAYAYTFAYFASIAAAWHFGIPDSGHDMFVSLLSIMTAAQTAIIAYYFGSSQGSARKDETINTAMKQP